MKKYLLRTILAFIIYHSSFIISFAQSQGPNSPGMVSEAAGGCLSCPGTDWMNLDSAKAADGSFATTDMYPFPNCFMSACFTAKAIEGLDFGFTIPANAVITGIQADVKRKALTPNAVRDTSVLLLKDGFPSGTDHASPAYWNVNDVYVTYGGPADLWGTTWTPQQIDTSAFGVSIKPVNYSNSGHTAAVDHIQMTVYYSVPNSIVSASEETVFTIYPNPATSSVIISVNESMIGSIAAITDITGRRIAAINLTTCHSPLAISDFPNGVYFITVTASDGSNFTRKLVISK